MAFNNFLKKAKETAANAASSAKNAAEAAKTKYSEKKQQLDSDKAEKERLRAENQAKADAKANEIAQSIAAAGGGAFAFESRELLTFTADYYDKLYLPAHSVSASKLIYHPLDKKLNKYAQKDFANYNAESETPVFMILGKGQQKVFLSTKALYFKKAYNEESGFFSIGAVPIEKIETLTYENSNESYIFKCNGVGLLNTKYGFEMDIEAFADYFARIKNRDYTITNEQIDALIKNKIGDKILAIVREYAYEDELLLYFAWGCDSLAAKDFVVCTDKQMVVLDREAFGLTKNVKQFYYEDVTSMATL